MGHMRGLEQLDMSSTWEELGQEVCVCVCGSVCAHVSVNVQFLLWFFEGLSL